MSNTCSRLLIEIPRPASQSKDSSFGADGVHVSDIAFWRHHDIRSAAHANTGHLIVALEKPVEGLISVLRKLILYVWCCYHLVALVLGENVRTLREENLASMACSVELIGTVGNARSRHFCETIDHVSS